MVARIELRLYSKRLFTLEEARRQGKLVHYHDYYSRPCRAARDRVMELAFRSRSWSLHRSGSNRRLPMHTLTRHEFLGAFPQTHLVSGFGSVDM